MSWFSFAPFFLVVMLCSLIFFQKTDKQKLTKITEEQTIQLSPLADNNYYAQLRIASANPTSQVLSATIVADDARASLLRQYLEEQKSPMAPYADVIVKNADLYQFDYRLLVAIAGCESNWGKRMPSGDSHNAWGIAVYTGQQSGATYKNWVDAINWVSKYVKEKYHDKGITNLKQISAIWAPPSVETGYSWANCVESLTSEIQ